VKRQYQLSRQPSGYTLIEIMMAIAVLAILAAVGVQSYASYIERTKVVQAVTDIGGMQTKIDQYALNNEYNYPISLADIGMGGKLDPWKRPYVYVNLNLKKGYGDSRRDKHYNPINTDYDLYSVGKDGQTQRPLNHKDSLDDVVRAADGKFIGLARDF
jgi:general secretion pathway protein G